MEAQEDGVMGKIIVQAGAQKIPVGQIIAVLAEEGDDLSSITIPENAAPAPASEQPKQQPKQEAEQKSAEQKAREQPRDERTSREHKEIKHSKPLFPSVSRLYVLPPPSSPTLPTLC